MKHAERKMRVQVHAEVCVFVSSHSLHIIPQTRFQPQQTRKHKKHTFPPPCLTLLHHFLHLSLRSPWHRAKQPRGILCNQPAMRETRVSLAAFRGCLWQDRGGSGGGGGQGRCWGGGGGGGVVRGEGWLLSSLLSAPSLGQAGRLCWAAQLLGSRCEPSCQRQAVARRSAARAHTSLSHLP